MQNGKSVTNLERMPEVFRAALVVMTEKARTYGESWKARGGRGAWYTLVRPLDRLTRIVEEHHQGDIFAAVEAGASGGDGTALDAIRDLRNYLTLVETEMVSRGIVRLPESEAMTEEQVEKAHDSRYDDNLGAGELHNGVYTSLDLGRARGLWVDGLGALSQVGESDDLDRAISLYMIHNPTVASWLVASRILDGGDRQIMIRIRPA